MDGRRRKIRLKQIDQQLASFESLRSLTPPKGGWIRAIREALGIGLESFASRLGVTSRSAVLKLEKNEVDGAITIRRLRDAANALECDLVVAFVPRIPLSEQAQRQANARARERLRRVGHTMDMEAQGVDPTEMDEMVQELADEILNKGGSALWQ